MDGTPNIAKIGILLGDNTRARMLSSLMHGKALTATELAKEAGVTAQTATSHLAKLEAGGLLTLRKQGRHKYFALATDDVAALLETLMGLTASTEPLRTITGPRDAALREARVCFNHLAGNMGTQLYDSLVSQRFLRTVDGNPVVTNKGKQFFTDFGIAFEPLQKSRAPLCRSCLDWSERRTHLAGSLGRALLTQFEALHWVRRNKNNRALTFTAEGKRLFETTFKT